MLTQEIRGKLRALNTTVIMTRSTVLSLLSATAVAIVACAAAGADIDLPEIGDSAGGIISPAQERKIGEAVLAQARQHAAVIDDPEVQAYLQSVGSRLANNVVDHEGTFNFFLINDPNINAFAVPGGVIGMHSGLILASQSESEVAAVLAHEITHVTQRHIARSFEAQSKMSLPMAAAMIGAMLLGATTSPDAGQAAIAAATAAQAQARINFTRANEFEADRIGIALLNDSGFDPHSMAAFFERLQTANRFTDPKHIPEILRSHPVSTTRVAEARGRAAEYPALEYEESFTYDLAKAKIRVLVAVDERALVSDYENNLASGRYKSEAAARYGYALALMETRDFSKARVQLQRLLLDDEEQVAYILALGKLEIAAGNFDAGIALLAYAHELYPGYRPVVLEYTEALLMAQRPDAAREVLREYSFGRSTQPRYFKLLAEAEERTGSIVESHIALSEYYFKLGRPILAKQQLELARRGNTADYYQRERIEARMEEINEFIAEEGGRGKRRRRS